MAALERVEHDRFVPTVGQEPDGLRPDVPSSTRDEDPHAIASGRGVRVAPRRRRTTRRPRPRGRRPGVDEVRFGLGAGFSTTGAGATGSGSGSDSSDATGLSDQSVAATDRSGRGRTDDRMGGRRCRVRGPRWAGSTEVVGATDPLARMIDGRSVAGGWADVGGTAVGR